MLDTSRHTLDTRVHDCLPCMLRRQCVAMDDDALATHAKASALFLEQWAGVSAVVMEGTADADAEAAAYEAQLRALPEGKLPRNEAGLPVFDMMLIGVGDDGHVGSLYPGRDEVLDDSGKWVLPVEMKVRPLARLAISTLTPLTRYMCERL